MKIVIMLVMFSSLAFAIEKTRGEKTVKELKMVNSQTTTTKPKAPVKKEADCDDKMKKPIEIKQESISLTGNTGCTLPE